jgi:cysteine-rich repeat protein
MLSLFGRTPARLILLSFLFLVAASRSQASCDVIPGANDVFRGALGQTDRPFASPGDFVAVAVEPGICDASSLGFVDRPGGATLADDYVVTLLFTPPTGTRTGVVLATSCASVAPKLAACGAALGGTATCIQAAPGTTDIQVVDSLHLSFRFPNTDALAGLDGDLVTLAGPMKIVVSPASDPALPCQLATQRCADVASGLSACIDELYRQDGTCRKTQADADASFGSFTALPLLNDYGAMVNNPGGTPVRFTTDAAGNALLPVDWRAVLVRVEGTPYPRLVRGGTDLPAFLSGPDAIRLPGASAISAWAPNGIRLPPVFTPLSDPTEQDLALFGTVDAPRAVTRIARRLPVTSRCFVDDVPGAVCATAAQCGEGSRCLPIATAEFRECSAGPNAGLPCLFASDCPESACGATTCRGGANAGLACATDAQCPGGECGPALFDFSTRYASGVGPVVISPGGYAVESQQPATLEGQTETGTLLAFVTPETLSSEDANGDVDAADPVLTVRSKSTGTVQAIGDGGSPGRAVTRIAKHPFRFSALAAEGDVVAYLEPEQQQGQCAVPASCDQNGDGELMDTLLRVYQIGGAPVWTTPLVADADPVIDGRSVAVSDGLVFFRRPEWGDAPVGMQGVSQDENGDFLFVGGVGDDANVPKLDDSGRTVCLMSQGKLVAADTNTVTDIYCRDLLTGALARQSVAAVGGGDLGFPSDKVGVSTDGRYAIFRSDDANVTDPPTPAELYFRDRDTDADGRFDEPGFTATVPMPGAPNGVLGPPNEELVVSGSGRHVVFAGGGVGGGIWAYDRDLDADGIFDEPGETRFDRMDVNDAGVSANGISRRPGVSADGRHVAFYSLSDNLGAVEDNNSANDVFVHDRDTDADGLFDEPGAIRTRLVSVDTTGLQVVGGGFIANSTNAISADGRFVTFQANASLTPGHVSGLLQTYVYDRDADEDGRFDEPGVFSVVLVSALSGTEQSSADGYGEDGVISPDGRYVAFAANREHTAWASLSAPNTGGRFLRDRITGLTHPFAVPGLGGIADIQAAPAGFDLFAELSSHARQKAFKHHATNLVLNDDNGEPDAFVEGVALEDALLDLTGEGFLDDFVLSVLDAQAQPPAPIALAAATQISVAGGNAAFLRPEPGLVRKGEDVNGDGDSDDQVVQLYRNRQGVVDLGLAATKVAISGRIVGALASEAGAQANFNADADQSDLVVAVNDVATATSQSWVSAGLAADSLGVAGQFAAFIAPEAQQGPGGTDYTEDLDSADRAMQCFDSVAGALVQVVNPLCVVPGTGTLAACSGNPTRSLPAEEFVVGDEVLAFRSREMALCNESFTSCSLNACDSAICDLNQDGDCCDDVLLGYDFELKRLVSSKSSVVPCPFEACDPRTPYKVTGTTVRFIENEGGEIDLNGNGVPGEFLVQLFNVRSGTIDTIAAVAPDPPSTGLLEEEFDGADPFGDPSPAPGSTPGEPPAEGTSSVLRSSGRCVETFAQACQESSQCGAGEFCDGETQTCARDHGACSAAAECPAGSNAECRAEVTTLSASDADGDAIIDPIDNCPLVSNADQADADRDGVGDLCDLATCGDGELAEEPGTGLPLEGCDDGNLEPGDGCSEACRIEPPAECDVNADLRIDQLDIDAIFAARGQTPTGLDDPRDANDDGTISVLDSRSCVNQCTAAKCALASNACGLLGIEVLAVLGFALVRKQKLSMRR